MARVRPYLEMLRQSGVRLALKAGRPITLIAGSASQTYGDALTHGGVLDFLKAVLSDEAVKKLTDRRTSSPGVVRLAVNSPYGRLGVEVTRTATNGLEATIQVLPEEVTSTGETVTIPAAEAMPAQAAPAPAAPPVAAASAPRPTPAPAPTPPEPAPPAPAPPAPARPGSGLRPALRPAEASSAPSIADAFAAAPSGAPVDDGVQPPPHDERTLVQLTADDQVDDPEKTIETGDDEPPVVRGALHTLKPTASALAAAEAESADEEADPMVVVDPAAPIPAPASVAPGVVVGAKGAKARVGVGKPTSMAELFADMVALGASDLHLKPDETPIVRVDGQIKSLDFRTRLTSDEIWSLLEPILPDTNRDEFLERADTDFACELPEKTARVRANVFRDLSGVCAAFRQIPNRLRTPKELGLTEEVIELCNRSRGLILVTGATGSGKSTTLAAMIDYINATREEHIITIEDPVEFVHPRKRCLVNQREVGVHTESFKTALRAALREDPDVLLVGELRDLETTSIALETAETGHLVLATLHTNGAAATVDRLIDQFPSERQPQVRLVVADVLLGVVSQTLCRRKEGGRVAAFEVMIVNHAISNLVREAKTVQIPSIMQTGRQSGMMTLHDSLLELVKRDEIEPDEAYANAIDKKAMADALKTLGFQSRGISSEARVILVVCPRSPPAPLSKVKRRKDVHLEFVSDVSKVTPQVLNKNVALAVFQWVEGESNPGLALGALCKDAARFGVPVLAMVPKGRPDLRSQAFAVGAADVHFLGEDGKSFETSMFHLAGIPMRRDPRRTLNAQVRVSIANAPWRAATLDDISLGGARLQLEATQETPPPRTVVRIKIRDDVFAKRQTPAGLALREVELPASVVESFLRDGQIVLRTRFLALTDEETAWLSELFPSIAKTA